MVMMLMIPIPSPAPFHEEWHGSFSPPGGHMRLGSIFGPWGARWAMPAKRKIDSSIDAAGSLFAKRRRICSLLGRRNFSEADVLASLQALADDGDDGPSRRDVQYRGESCTGDLLSTIPATMLEPPTSWLKTSPTVRCCCTPLSRCQN